MVDILVLNYNDAETTLEYVNQVKNFKCVRKILIVDNCSTDDSLKVLLECKFEKVEIISSSENCGYGAGNNFGIKYLMDYYDSKYILISNPDVIVTDSTIKKLEDFLKKHQDFAVVAPFMLNPKGEKQINTAFHIPDIKDYIMSFGMIWTKYFSKYFYKDILESNREVKVVDGVSGSMLMVNANIMIEKGMYDENIFLYCEEIVLGIKLKNVGLKTALLTRETFIHNHSISISKTYKSELERHKLLVKSKLYVIKKYYNASPIMYLGAYVMSRVSLIETWLWTLLRPFLKLI